jgi:hypothetical protein
VAVLVIVVVAVVAVVALTKLLHGQKPIPFRPSQKMVKMWREMRTRGGGHMGGR